ncbi:MAG: Eco57I restriction-modification methylase domain-containing protein, partial [Candidatus Aenigmatarchaeota archaeon]
VVKKIYNASQPIFDDEDFRIYPKTKKELLLEGVETPEEESELLKLEPEHLPYIGNKWGGKYLRAPEIYFKILEKGKDKLVRLGDIAEVRRGFTTGANEFFYLKPVGMSVKEVVEISEKNPDALIPVKNSAGWEGEIEARFLKPVIKSPRELRTIVVRLEDLNYLVFMCHEPKNKLKGTNALKYIEWGEKERYQKRPTCRSRERWWDLGISNFSNLLCMMSYNDRHGFWINNVSLADARLYDIFSGENSYKLCFCLNTSFTYMQQELIGRINLGEGALDFKVYETSKLFIIDPNFIKEDALHNIKQFLKRPIYSIFTELGFDPNKPIREQEPNPLSDRKALDDIIFDALGLTEEERKEVYWSVAELVKNRLEKARSV